MLSDLLNSTVENIGARRLQTVMERVLDELSFDAPDQDGKEHRIDAAYVEGHVGELGDRHAAPLSAAALMSILAALAAPVDTP